jgi:hypothetical protein
LTAVKKESEHVENVGKDGLVADDKGEGFGTAQRDDDITIPRKPFVQRLKVFNATYSEENFLILLIKPFLVLKNPAVMWSTLLLSISTAWFIVISFVSAQIFSFPPYNLDATHIGYMNAGNVVGGLIGCIVAGGLSDPVVKWLSKKNKGIYEPEFRLVLLVPWAIFTAISFFLFGWMCEKGSSPAQVAVVQGVGLFAFQFLSVAMSTYMIDSYRNISVEIFIIGMVVKNFVFFGLSCKYINSKVLWLGPITDITSVGVNDWVTAWGPKRVFDCIGGIQLGLFVISISIWIFGKRLRAYFYAN